MLVEMPDQLAYFGAELFDDKIVKVGGMNFQEVAKDNVSMYDERIQRVPPVTICRV